MKLRWYEIFILNRIRKRLEKATKLKFDIILSSNLDCIISLLGK